MVGGRLPALGRSSGSDVYSHADDVAGAETVKESLELAQLGTDLLGVRVV